MGRSSKCGNKRKKSSASMGAKKAETLPPCHAESLPAAKTIRLKGEFLEANQQP